MNNLNNPQDKTSYSWQSVLLWGNFTKHCKKAREGSLGNRLIHSLMAALEFLPIISQVSSICEKLIVDFQTSSKSKPLIEKKFSIETSNTELKRIPNPSHLINSPLQPPELDIRQTPPAIQNIETPDKKEVSNSVPITSVKEVSKGVFTAEGKTSNGETIYFGMELIDDASRDIWMDYSEAANNLCNGILPWIQSNLNDENKLKEAQLHSGLSEEEFKNLTEQFQKRGLHPNGKLEGAISDIKGGIAGFMIYPNLGAKAYAPATYVAYISKTPITGPISLPKTETNVKIFQEKYKNIVMSVGVRLDDKRPLFENRGIFRNPFSVIEGGYSNISTQLHAFTGKVMKERLNETLGDKQKVYMSVSPIYSMREILVKKIGLEKIKTKQDIPEELRLKSNGILEQQFLIKLEDLANLH